MTKTNFLALPATVVTPEFLQAINNPVYSPDPQEDGEIPLPTLDQLGVNAAIALEATRATTAEAVLAAEISAVQENVITENTRAINAEAALKALIPDRFVIDITNPLDSNPLDPQSMNVYSGRLSPDSGDFSRTETVFDVNGDDLLCFVFDITEMNPGSSLFIYNSVSYETRPSRIVIDGASYSDRLGYDVKVAAGSQAVTLVLPSHIPDEDSPDKTWKTFLVPAGEEHRIVYDFSSGSVRYTEYKAIRIG